MSKNNTVYYDHYGSTISVPQGMMFPVLCRHCGSVYDIASVEPTARYADATIWTTPCCQVAGVDDRAWVSPRHYTPLPSSVI